MRFELLMAWSLVFAGQVVVGKEPTPFTVELLGTSTDRTLPGGEAMLVIESKTPGLEAGCSVLCRSVPAKKGQLKILVPILYSQSLWMKSPGRSDSTAYRIEAMDLKQVKRIRVLENPAWTPGQTVPQEEASAPAVPVWASDDFFMGVRDDQKSDSTRRYIAQRRQDSLERIEQQRRIAEQRRIDSIDREERLAREKEERAERRRLEKEREEEARRALAEEAEREERLRQAEERSNRAAWKALTKALERNIQDTRNQVNNNYRQMEKVFLDDSKRRLDEARANGSGSYGGSSGESSTTYGSSGTSGNSNQSSGGSSKSSSSGESTRSSTSAASGQKSTGSSTSGKSSITTATGAITSSPGAGTSAGGGGDPERDRRTEERLRQQQIAERKEQERLAQEKRRTEEDRKRLELEKKQQKQREIDDAKRQVRDGAKSAVRHCPGETSVVPILPSVKNAPSANMTITVSCPNSYSEDFRFTTVSGTTANGSCFMGETKTVRKDFPCKPSEMRTWVKELTFNE